MASHDRFSVARQAPRAYSQREPLREADPTVRRFSTTQALPRDRARIQSAKVRERSERKLLVPQPLERQPDGLRCSPSDRRAMTALVQRRCEIDWAYHLIISGHTIARCIGTIAEG